MAVVLGLVLLALGASLLVAWWSPALVAALQVTLILLLLLAGFIVFIVGYAELKARKAYARAISEPIATPAADESPPH